MSNDIQIQISYSREFEEKDFSKIAEFQNVSIRGVYVEKSMDPGMLGIIVLSLAGLWFLEGYVKELGRIAAQGTVKGIPSLMKHLSQAIKKDDKGVRVRIHTSYTTDYGITQIEINFSDISKLSDEEKMTLPHEIGAKLIARLDSQDEYIRKIGVVCDNSEITDFFYITDKLEVFEAEL